MWKYNGEEDRKINQTLQTSEQNWYVPCLSHDLLLNRMDELKSGLS